MYTYTCEKYSFVLRAAGFFFVNLIAIIQSQGNARLFLIVLLRALRLHIVLACAGFVLRAADFIFIKCISIIKSLYNAIRFSCCFAQDARCRQPAAHYQRSWPRPILCFGGALDEMKTCDCNLLLGLCIY